MLFQQNKSLLIVCLMIVAGLFVGCQAFGSDYQYKGVSSLPPLSVPDFTLQAASGEPFRLSDTKGDYTLIAQLASTRLAFLGALSLVGLQLVPLPSAWLKVISPHLSETLPLWTGSGGAAASLGTVAGATHLDRDIRVPTFGPL